MKIPRPCSIRIGAVFTTVLMIACGTVKDSEPPDTFQRLGLGERPEPIRWVQTAGDGGATRFIYEDIVRYENLGEPQETPVRAELEITEHPQTQQLTYRWHERHLRVEAGGGSLRVVKTFDADGIATKETIAGRKGPLTVYRLQSTTLPENYRTWVVFGQELVVPAPDITESDSLGDSVTLFARATPHAIEVTAQPSELSGWKLRLHPGEELTVRLDRRTKNPAARVKDGSNGPQLALVDTKSEPAFESDQTTDVYRFKAVEAGWADLEFNMMTTPTFRILVE